MFVCAERYHQHDGSSLSSRAAYTGHVLLFGDDRRQCLDRFRRGDSAGCPIGENSIIGSGSIVTKDIPANVIAFGAPCKVHRPIDEQDKEYYYRQYRVDAQI